MSSLEKLLTLVNNHLAVLPENKFPSTWTLLTSPVEGRGVFSTRDISAGDLIFVDHALIMGPRKNSKTSDRCVNCFGNNASQRICVNGCDLPVCFECQTSPSHLEECQLINTWKTTDLRDTLESDTFAKNIVPLRALLLNTEKQELFMNLAIHESKQHGSEVKYIKKYFEISGHEEGLMIQACCALDANAYEMVLVARDGEFANLRGLFPISALLNHNCSPNTRSSFDKFGRMYVHASSNIPEGSEIFTSYTGLLWGTPARRHHLLNTKHFECDCLRCCDKTERGTRLSAFCCLDRSCSGVILPNDPINFSSSWTCEVCGLEIAARQVGALQGAIGGLLKSLQINNPDAIYEFIQCRLNKFLPEFNHIMLELKNKVLWALGVADGYLWHELTAEWLSRAETLSRESIEVCNAVGLSGAPLNARLRLGLHRCLLEKLRRQEGAPVATDLEEEVIDNIKKCYEVLKYDVLSPKDLELRVQLASSGVQKLIEYENKLIQNKLSDV